MPDVLVKNMASQARVEVVRMRVLETLVARYPAGAIEAVTAENVEARAAAAPLDDVMDFRGVSGGAGKRDRAVRAAGAGRRRPVRTHNVGEAPRRGECAGRT
jgi:hypothetical protein